MVTTGALVVEGVAANVVGRGAGVGAQFVGARETGSAAGARVVVVMATMLGPATTRTSSACAGGLAAHDAARRPTASGATTLSASRGRVSNAPDLGRRGIARLRVVAPYPPTA